MARERCWHPWNNHSTRSSSSLWGETQEQMTATLRTVAGRPMPGLFSYITPGFCGWRVGLNSCHGYGNHPTATDQQILRSFDRSVADHQRAPRANGYWNAVFVHQHMQSRSLYKCFTNVSHPPPLRSALTSVLCAPERLSPSEGSWPHYSGDGLFECSSERQGPQTSLPLHSVSSLQYPLVLSGTPSSCRVDIHIVKPSDQILKGPSLQHQFGFHRKV